VCVCVCDYDRTSRMLVRGCGAVLIHVIIRPTVILDDSLYKHCAKYRITAKIVRTRRDFLTICDVLRHTESNSSMHRYECG